MTYLLDSNILLYAHRTAMPQYQKTSDWLTAAINNNQTILLTESVILSFIRIGTNRKIFDPPMTVADAGRVTARLLAEPNVLIHTPQASHYAALAAQMTKLKLTDNMTMDAHLACVALTTKAIIVTNDRDFKKFPFVKTLNPSVL